MKKAAIVYWLLPAKPERELFCEVIRILREQFDAPNFEPHLTLFVTANGRQPPARILRQIRSGPIRLSTNGVAFSPKFTKTLYVRFKPNSSLRKLALDLRRAAKSRAQSPTDPHISLLYKKTSRAAQKEVAQVMKLPFRTVVFDSIAAVRLTLPVRTRGDVERWRIVASKKLAP
jgi:2'-5' RNA ligase